MAMRVQLRIDGYPLEISTRDPELLGRWLAEVFAGIYWTPATYVEVQVWPSPVMTPNDGQPFQLDWIADSRVITRTTPVKSPQDVVNALQAYVDEAARL